MERKTLLLELIALLTLLSTTVEGLIPIRNFGCRWQSCRDRLVCGFDQFGPETTWTNIQRNLTMDDKATVRCQQAGYNETQIRCLYEGLRETKFDQVESHKFKLQLGDEQVEEFNLTLAEMEVPVWNADTDQNNVTFPLPERPPQPKGFYHDPEKEELHIYWQPLDVWEFCSKNMWYKVNASSGQMTSVIGRDFAILSGWKPELPANLTIWSENSQGRSWNSSLLNVPILTNADNRKPQKVFYEDTSKSLHWAHPKEKDKLVGYTLYWCLMSSTNSSYCDDFEPIQSFNLREYRTSFQFSKSMTQYHMAVVANYRDGISGGLVWSTPAPSEGIAYLVFLVVSVMIIFLVLYGLCFKIYHKIRYMAGIEVELPVFHRNSYHHSTINKIRNDLSFPLEGNISPETFSSVIIDGYLVKNSAQPNARSLTPAPSDVKRGTPLVVAYTVLSLK